VTKSDLVLLAYIVFLVPLMLVGFGYARRKKFEPHHKLVMTSVTIINWVLILFIMAVTYLRDVAPQLSDHLNSSLVIIPSIHLIVGGIAQLLATYLVVRMWFEKQLPSWIKVKKIKPYMRVTLVLWLLTAVLGLTTWAAFYHGFLVSPQPTNAAASANTVNMVSGEQFQPASLTVPAGTTVHFVNTDTMGHTVTADDNSFDSGEVAPGKSFDVTLNQPGDVAYYCAFHGGEGGSGMSGVIHVTGNAVKVATQAATVAATKTP